ncbi:MAG: aldehyde ferredoxin oxidoreductase family protein [Promethearchaeota archaeon]
MILGLNKKILVIDLSTGEIKDKDLSEDLILNYIGGRGLGVKFLTDILPKNLDPLSKDNIMIFAAGPLTGTIAPTSGRFSLVTKSPLTNTIFHSNTGGFFGPYLKKCGYDGLIIKGKAKNPCSINIDGVERVRIDDASDLWGLTTSETVKKIIKKEGQNTQILSIGPAGENLVLFASIMNQANRAFGRGGVGAVMGSKNLKAIVVKNGRVKLELKNKDRLKTLSTVSLDKIKLSPITSQGLYYFGTAALVKVINQFGMFPVNNFQKAYTEIKTIDLVSGEQLREKYLEKEEGCYNCIIRCGRLTNTGEQKGKGPEYESLWALGPLCGIFDLKTITHTNYLCNDLGLDTISTGSTIACAMELKEKGLLSNTDLNFGNASNLIKIVHDIVYKKGIGRELAEGSYRFASKYGGAQYAMQVKGMEIAAYDPRGAFGHALNYATSNRGACHLTGFMVALEVLGAPKKINRFSALGKSDLLALKQNQSAVEDSLIVCKFVGYALEFEYQSRFLSAILDKEISVSDLILIGERIFNLERLFNIREGFTKKDDYLPKRFLEESLKEGPSKGRVVPLDNMLDEYYRVRGWNSEGVPTDETLERLSLKRLT